MGIDEFHRATIRTLVSAVGTVKKSRSEQRTPLHIEFSRHADPSRDCTVYRKGKLFTVNIKMLPYDVG